MAFRILKMYPHQVNPVFNSCPRNRCRSAYTVRISRGRVSSCRCPELMEVAPSTAGWMSSVMYLARCTAHSRSCLATSVPTGPMMAASYGKMPTTLVRRLVAPLSHLGKGGLVGNSRSGRGRSAGLCHLRRGKSNSQILSRLLPSGNSPP